MADGRIIIDTEIDSKGAEKDLKAFNGKLGSLVKTGIKSITGLIAGATAALGGLSAIGLKFNSDMENYLTNFEVMLGSAEAAVKHVEDLKKFAAKTPFEMTDLANASKLMLQFGADVNDIMPNLQMLGDISLGNSEKFQSLALVFSQVQSQGKLMGQDLLQMINAGFNPLQIISEKTGKSMAELKEEMADGAITYEMVAEAMKVATSEGGRFYQGMEKQSQTMTGLMSTLKDNATSLIGDVFQPISNSIKNDILPAALRYVDELQKAFESDGITGVVSKFGEIGGEIVSQLANSLPKIVDMGVNIAQSFITGIKNNLPAIATGAINIVMSLVNGIIEMLPMLLEVGLQALITLGQGIAQNLPTLIPTIVNLIISMCDMIIENLPLIIDVAIDIILALVQGLINALPTLIAEVPRIINSFASGIYNALPQILKAGVDIIVMLVKGLIDSIPIIIQNLPQIIMAIINAFTLVNWASIGKNLISAIGSGIKSMVSNIGTIAKFTAESVVNGIKGIFSAGGSIGKNLISWIANGISSSIGNLLQAARNVAISAINGIKNILSWDSAASIGKNLIQGLWNGISNMGGWILDKISGFASSIIGGIKGVFGIHSPSRVMRDLIGTNIVKGIGVGIDVETPNLEKDIDANMSDLVAKMKGIVDYETTMTTARVVAYNNSLSDGVEESDTKSGKQVIENHIHVDIEGKEVAYAIAPYQDILAEYGEGR